MSLDDQLFKPDGTLLTRVDIVLLKVARFVANFFLGDDEETYSPSLKRMVNMGAAIYIIAAVAFVCSGSILVAIGICFISGGLIYRSANDEIRGGCTGKGSNVEPVEKASYILLLVSGPILYPITFNFSPPENLGQAFVALLVADLAYSMYVLAAFYVVRLNNVPPKRKKAKATSLQLIPTSE